MKKELEDDNLTICPECAAQETKEVVVPTQEEKKKQMSGMGIASLILGIFGNCVKFSFGYFRTYFMHYWYLPWCK